MRFPVALVLASLLAACATPPRMDPGAASPAAARCERLYATLDDAVTAAGVADAMAARVTGFPYLRASRFLASYRGEALESPAFDQWVSAMVELDREAREVEVANLPEGAAETMNPGLAREGVAPEALRAELDRCANELRARDLSDPAGRSRLREAAVVPDDYSVALRIAGAYPLTALGFAVGVRHYEQDTRAAFAQPYEALPVRGRLQTYRPRDEPSLNPDALRDLLARARANPLRIPVPAPEDARQLFAMYAPVYVVDERDANDRIGRPALAAGEGPAVDTEVPVVFTRIAQTRIDGEALLQLVYTAWFPARPPSGAFDILSGRLDGIVWRVTLGADGAPILFDSIHPCGCYHWMFSTMRLVALPGSGTVEEEALIPQTLPPVEPGQRITLRVESGTHYLRRVLVDAPVPVNARTYGFEPDDALRNLPQTGGGTKSLFGPDGIVAGTERDERFWFWPMGIESPGAMRQWGRHPTAFVGRRHFDEAFLVGRYFASRESSAASARQSD